MTQFLQAVMEERMGEALALSKTILDHEPRNEMMKDYRETLERYIRNEREAVVFGDNVPPGKSSESSGSSSDADSGSDTDDSDLSSTPQRK
ncbi:unnamed protein product [Chrysoparadoxa australica]